MCDRKLFDVTRELNGAPMAVWLREREEAEALEEWYLSFCIEPRHEHEIRAMLQGSTACPEDRVTALAMTIWARLFATRRGRLIDDSFGKERPYRKWTSDAGKQYLAELQAAREGAA